MITAEQLRPHLNKIWSPAKQEIRDGFIDAWDDACQRFQINTYTRQIYFLAQMTHECNRGTVTKESLYYTTVSRLHEVWPNRFANDSSSKKYLRNERAVANKAYQGRMGNTDPDDGYNYRGRGFLQITGKEDYIRYGRMIGQDLVGNPDLAFDPKYALMIAAAEFGKHETLAACDAHNFKMVTQKVNGGQNGAADRKRYLEMWMSEIRESSEAASEPVKVRPDTAILMRGDSGYAVKALQEQLKNLKYYKSIIDGVFGRGTENAVRDFQEDVGLEKTGIVDKETQDTLNHPDIGTNEPSETRSVAKPEDIADIVPSIGIADKIKKAATYVAGGGLTIDGVSTTLDAVSGNVEKAKQIQESVHPVFDYLLAHPSIIAVTIAATIFTAGYLVQQSGLLRFQRNEL